MRTTLNIEADAYSFLFAFARGKGLTLSAAASELLRRAEQVPEPDSGKLRMNEYGYLEVAATGYPITSEMVKESSEDELI